MINPTVDIERDRSLLTTHKATFGGRLTQSSTERATFLSLHVDKRAMKIAGFAVEIFAWIIIPPLMPLGLSAGLLEKRSPAIQVIVGLATGLLAIPLTPLLLPLTLPIGVIWAIGRAIRYRATRTTFEISGKKYYVNAKKYRQELQQLFHLDPENRPHSKKIYKRYNTDQQIFDLWRNLVRTSPEEAGSHFMTPNHLIRSRYELERSDAPFLEEHINSGVAPQRLLYIRTDEGYEFGSIFAHLNKRLHHQDPVNENEQLIFEQWAHFLPADAKSTCVLTLEVATEVEEDERVNLFDVINNLTGKTQNNAKPPVVNTLVDKERVPLFVSNYEANYLPFFQRGGTKKSATKI